MDWEKCKKHIMYDHDFFYQKMIKIVEEEKIYANLHVYTSNNKTTYELDIQIPEDVSITGMTINIKSFSYIELNFEAIERDAKMLINSMT